MAKEQYLTEEGLKQKEEELEYLKTVARKEVAEKIRGRRGFLSRSQRPSITLAKS